MFETIKEKIRLIGLYVMYFHNSNFDPILLDDPIFDSLRYSQS